MAFSVLVSDAAAALGLDNLSAAFSDTLASRLGSWVSTDQSWGASTPAGKTETLTFHYSNGYLIQLSVTGATDTFATLTKLDLQSAAGKSLITYSGSVVISPGTFSTSLADDSALGGNDTIIGSTGNDTLEGYGGNDSIDGGAGTDTAIFRGLHASYTVTRGSTSTTVSGPDGSDVLTNVERLQFDDGVLAFDVQGTAGEAYRLYQAAFNRTPDLPGLGFQIHDLDFNLNIFQVAANFIASPEFQSKYGNVDNKTFITLLYQNVLHRAPDPGGLQFHLDEFASGQTRADMLVHFSESPENQANVTGAINNGIFYVAYGS